MCAFDDGTMRQSPRMYGWERITVLPGPQPGTSYLYSKIHNKYIIDQAILYGVGLAPAPIQSSASSAADTSINLHVERTVRIEGAPINQPRALGQFPYRVVSSRYSLVDFGDQYDSVFLTNLRAPTAGEYHYFVYQDFQSVPSPNIDLTSVRTLGAGEFWVRTHHGQFMCVYPDRVGPTGAQLAWERIRVIKADENVYGRNRYHLWSDAQQRYLSFHHTGLALSTNTQSWETFRIVSHPKHYEKFSIFSDYHGKFLRQACHGCGFDASLSNTDAQNGDVTAFEFMPISWFSHDPFNVYNYQAKPWRFEATGKFINFHLNGLKQDIHPLGIRSGRVFVILGVVFPYEGYGIYHTAENTPSTSWLRFDSTLSIVSSSGTPTSQSPPSDFHDIVPHPKIPNRYAVRLCYSCPHAWYLAAHPDGSTVTTTEDGASDYTAIEIIF